MSTSDDIYTRERSEPESTHPGHTAAPFLLSVLTEKDREVLDLLVTHHSNKEIGRKLSLAESTVEGRLRAIRSKLGTQGRNDTARLYAAVSGIEGKPFDGFPEVVGEHWACLAEGWERTSSEPLQLRDASALSGRAAWRAEGARWPDLEAMPQPFSLPVMLLIVAALAGFLGLAFLAVMAMVRDLASHGVPGFLT